MQKVLIANRGEIAVRVIRACRTPGYAVGRGLRRPRPRRAARPDGRRGVRARRHHARATPTCVIDKVIDVAAAVRRRRRPPRLRLPVRERRLRPGRHRRRADLDRPVPAGDPRPRRQGDRPAHRASAPARRWSPGTKDPVTGRRRGGRVRRGARPADRDQGRLRRRRARPEDRPRRSRRSPSSTTRAVREAVAAFGRGECFVERYLDRPRHVEAQVLADQHGNVDRRRHPRLLAAAPQPEAGRGGAGAVPHRRAARHASTPRPRRSAARPSYHGAGTVEYLVGADGVDLASSRSTPGCRSSTRSPRRPAASTWSASSSASPRARSCASTRTRRRAGTPSSSGSTARTRAATSCPRPGTVTELPRAGRARACASTPASRPAR